MEIQIRDTVITVPSNTKQPQLSEVRFWVQKKASYLHRTATTAYPCCVPTLGDSAGAGRVGLASCKYTTVLILWQYFSF